jgi:hypothetical protein
MAASLNVMAGSLNVTADSFNVMAGLDPAIFSSTCGGRWLDQARP